MAVVIAKFLEKKHDGNLEGMGKGLVFADSGNISEYARIRWRLWYLKVDGRKTRQHVWSQRAYHKSGSGNGHLQAYEVLETMQQGLYKTGDLYKVITDIDN